MLIGRAGATESRQQRAVCGPLLVAFEVGLSTICLAAAGLLLNSFVRLTHIDKGFDAEHVMSIDFYLAGARYSSGANRSEFLRKALEVLTPLPGVTTMGVVNVLPLTGEGSNNPVVCGGRRTCL